MPADTEDFRLAVKNAAYTLSEKEQERVNAALRAGAAKGEEPKNAYWIYDDDNGCNYCRECALTEIEKRVAIHKHRSKAEKDKFEKPSLDGGWRTEHDSTPFCETCHCRLDGNLTYYGAEQELEHFLEHGVDLESADDCLSMEEVVNTVGWNLYLSEYNQYENPVTTDNHNRDAQERHWNLGKIGRQILEKLDATPST